VKIVLLDHGLYTELKDETRLSYTKLWRGILTQNEEQIKEASREIVGERYYQVFTTMIVAESYDSVMDQGQLGGEAGGQKDAAAKAEVRDYALLNSREILEILSKLPGDVKLILKTTYYLKAVYERLGNPVNSTDVVNDTTWAVYYNEWQKMSRRPRRTRFLAEFVKYWTLKLLIGVQGGLAWARRGLRWVWHPLLAGSASLRRLWPRKGGGSGQFVAGT